MSIGSITSTLLGGLDSTQNNSFSKMQQAWKDLEKSLKSGDLDSAKKAYATITQLQQQIASHLRNPQGSSQIDSDMQALGKALDSGNLSDAQQAFATLENDMKSALPAPSQRSTTTSSSTDVEIIELLQQLEASSGGDSSSSSASNSSSGISIKA